MDGEEALSRLRDAVALWYVDLGRSAAIVYAACDLLVTGIDGPAVVALAAVNIGVADEEVPGLLDAALVEVGITPEVKGSAAADEKGLRMLAARAIAGELTPRAFVTWTHRRFDYFVSDVIDGIHLFHENYSLLEDPYVRDLVPETREEIDAQVLAEAWKLAVR
ncbi:hypothetical protein [Amycolatopsis samaneae]|uniref:Uncharacterized protein n=1 Tax=Amycolatopsis samaneae TaxID=664691 RepID=A0ABW5GQU6_9PSEU